MSDQGYSYLASGCTQCRIYKGDKAIRPAFVITERYGHRYWTCPMCEGSFGEVDAALASPPPAPAPGQPLTEQQVLRCWGEADGTRHGFVPFARGIERAHGIGLPGAAEGSSHG